MKNEFIKLYKKHIKRRGADKLLGYLVDKGFLEAPASTKYHGSYEGGLAEHSVNVMNRLMMYVKWICISHSLKRRK